jgi:hypothetical protein
LRKRPLFTTLFEPEIVIFIPNNNAILKQNSVSIDKMCKLKYQWSENPV